MELDLSNKVERLTNEGNYDGALELILGDQSNEAHIHRSIIAEKQGRFKDALRYARLAGREAKPVVKIHAMVCEVYALWRLAETELAHEVIDEGIQLIDDIDGSSNHTKLIQFKAEFYYLKGILYNTSGELKRPFDLFKMSYDLRRQINHPTMSHSLNAMGIIKELMGELITSLEYHEQALELKREQSNPQDIYRSLNNIGWLFYKTGNFKKSLQYFEEGYELSQKYGFSREQLILQENIAMLHQKMKAYTKSEKIYLKILEKKLLRDDPNWLAKSYRSLIHLYQDQSQYEQVEYYMDKLEQLCSKFPENTNLLIILKTEQAKQMASSSRPYMVMKAQSLLREVLEQLRSNDNGDIHEMINIYVELIRLLLRELAYERNEAVIHEINAFIQEIEMISHQESMILERIEVLELVAKLRLLQNRPRDAQTILTSAQILAEKRGFVLRAKQIAEEHDRIIEQGLLIGDKMPISNRMEELQIDDILARLNNETERKEVSIENEHPILNLIITEAGTVIYARSHDPSIKLNKGLIGSFVSAITSFGNEIFSIDEILDSPRINRIEHQEYSLLLKSLSNSIICYVFTGPSYHALRRFSRFCDEIQDRGYWKNLMHNQQLINKEAVNQIDQLVTELFTL